MTTPITGAPSGAEVTGTPSGTGGVETGSGEQQSAPGAPSGATSTTVVTEETVPKSVVEQMRNQLRAADQKREAAEQTLKQIRDKDLPEAEKLKRDNEELLRQNQKLQADLRSQAVDTAFRDVTDYQWQDPTAARKLLDLTGVEVGDDRTVTGMKEAAKRLATQYPWMLKEKAPEGETPAVAGAPPMNGKPGTDKPDKKGLVKRFPALGTRVAGQ